MTPEQAKAGFRARGETVADWSARHGFRRDYVYKILNGRSVGVYGEMHRIAVALGIKPDPVKHRV